MIILSTFLICKGGWAQTSDSAIQSNLEEVQKIVDASIKDSKKLIHGDSFYDPKRDYSQFPGRVTDLNHKEALYKVFSEDKNVRFFKAADEVQFTLGLAASDGPRCKGFVRSVEENYFVMRVVNLTTCHDDKEYFRRGTALYFYSDQLESRVREASVYRNILMQKKKDFLVQLSNVNHFIWSFDQEKIRVAADFDKKIVEMEREKEKELSRLQVRLKENLSLQKELAKRLDDLDQSIDFYRVQKNELALDRWRKDQDAGLPFGELPQPYSISD